MFSLAPLFAAASPIPSHALVALAATAVALSQFVLPKGTLRHRILGWAFVLGMVYVALSALFISTIGTWGYFSPIHLTIPATLLALTGAIIAARHGRIRAHGYTMISLTVLALVVTGGFTLLPGRVMHAAVFGAP